MKQYKVLFVCMGNICRSPAGEGVLEALLAQDNTFDGSEYVIDSAGTIGFHENAPPDERMRQAAAQRGYELTSKARRVQVDDFKTFDLILAMDKDNYRDLEALRNESAGDAELKLFCDFCQEHTTQEVPDPYYGGAQGFETVLDLLEDGCRQIVTHMRTRLP